MLGASLGAGGLAATVVGASAGWGVPWGTGDRPPCSLVGGTRRRSPPGGSAAIWSIRRSGFPTTWPPDYRVQPALLQFATQSG